MEKEKVSEMVEELVWSAWSLGAQSAHPMTTDRGADRLHQEIWTRLQEVLTHIDR